MEYELNDGLQFVDDVVQHSNHATNAHDETKVASADLAAQKKKNQHRFVEQVQSIYIKYGELEEMREKLKFTRKQIAEYLMVDPSAWSRWVNGDPLAVPPHVVRTMGLIMEQNLKLTVQLRRQDLYLRAAASDSESGLHEQYQSQIEALKEKLEVALKQSEKFEILKMGWKVLLIFNSVLILYVLFR